MSEEVQFVRVKRPFQGIGVGEVLRVNAVCRPSGSQTGCLHVERGGTYRIIPESHVECCLGPSAEHPRPPLP